MSIIGRKWKGYWSKHDPDTVFAYDTFKMVTIQDRYLGLLHHSLQFGILIYIVIFVLFVEKEFLKLENAVGIVRLDITNAGNLSHVDPGLSSYCDIPPANTGKPTCIFPPLDQISDGSGSSLFISTHIDRTDYYANCDPNLLDCHPQTVNGTQQFFIGNLLNINISIDHSAQVNFEGKAPLGYLQRVKNPNSADTQFENCDKCSPSQFRSLSADNIPLSTFLEAAGLNLSTIANDYLQGTDEYTGPEDFRSFGAVILLSISYDNQLHYFRGDPPIVYYYQPLLIRDVDDYLIDSIYTAYPYNRTVLYKKGIHIVGILAGQLGHFTFQTLLIQLTTSLALMKVATTAVDLIAINILPAKVLYRKAKYEKTEDFSDLKDHHSKSDFEKENVFPVEVIQESVGKDGTITASVEMGTVPLPGSVG